MSDNTQNSDPQQQFSCPHMPCDLVADNLLGFFGDISLPPELGLPFETARRLAYAADTVLQSWPSRPEDAQDDKWRYPLMNLIALLMTPKPRQDEKKPVCPGVSILPWSGYTEHYRQLFTTVRRQRGPVHWGSISEQSAHMASFVWAMTVVEVIAKGVQSLLIASSLPKQTVGETFTQRCELVQQFLKGKVLDWNRCWANATNALKKQHWPELLAVEAELQWEASEAGRQPTTLQSKLTKNSEVNVIRFLNKRLYQVGESTHIAVTENEDFVIRAFIGRPSMDKPTLISRAGFDEAPKTLNKLKKRYNGYFASAISTPGARGRGGYSVHVIDMSPKP